MSNITIQQNVLNKDTLDIIKKYVFECPCEYIENSTKINVVIDDYKLFNEAFSQINNYNEPIVLKEIQCFFLKPKIEDVFDYEKDFYSDGIIFDFQIVKNGTKRPLIGNTKTYAKDFSNLLLKKFIANTLSDQEIYNSNKDDISRFIQNYDFQNTAYDVNVFVLSLLEYSNLSYTFQYFLSLLEKVKKCFLTYDKVISFIETNNDYYKNIDDYLFSLNLSLETRNLHSFVIDAIVEKLNSSTGYAYLQFAIQNEPILRNYILKDNQCICYPGQIIHKRFQYERFTDDKIIHILFKCVKKK